MDTVTIYIILLLAAALSVALLAIPKGTGPVLTDFATGKLTASDFAAKDPSPRLELLCRDDGTLEINRIGLPAGLNNTATVALAITRKGFDISIEERITPGSGALLDSELQPVDTATFYIPNLARERYHISYNSAPTSTFTSFTLLNRPGLRSSRPLRPA